MPLSKTRRARKPPRTITITIMATRTCLPYEFPYSYDSHCMPFLPVRPYTRAPTGLAGPMSESSCLLEVVVTRPNSLQEGLPVWPFNTGPVYIHRLHSFLRDNIVFGGDLISQDSPLFKYKQSAIFMVPAKYRICFMSQVEWRLK